MLVESQSQFGVWLVEVVSSSRIVDHGFEGYRSDSEDIHLLLVELADAHGSFFQEREALRGEGEELVNIPGVIADEMVVEGVIILYIIRPLLGVQWWR